jgi:predicted regulator of Ras-like GTPase activity (Roadblock/LC7/MglB family)
MLQFYTNYINGANETPFFPCSEIARDNRWKAVCSGFACLNCGAAEVKRRHKIQIGGNLHYVFDKEQLTAIEDILDRDLIDLGVHSVFLIDMAGNIVATKETGHEEHDIYSLAALAAGNFGAVSTMAKLIGEEESIHFSKVTSDFLLITIFGKELSLGFLRLKVAEATEKIVAILGS